MKSCSVMQPTFLPWVGYFDLIDAVDFFIFYDDVQFVKQSWHTRNRISTSNGVSYISLPVLKNKLNTNINQIIIDNTKPWQKKLIKTFFYNYQKSPFFNEVFPFIEKILNDNKENLIDLNVDIITTISQKLGIKTNFLLSSQLNSLEGKRDNRLVDICKELNCKFYLSTLGSASYIEDKNPGGEFSKNDIKLMYHNYSPVNYSQCFGDFKPYMSIIDLLFNVGFKESLNFIKAGRKKVLVSQDLFNK
jgi:hypothetical protein